MRNEIMRWILFPRYMIGYKLFLIGMRLSSWALGLSPSLGRELSRYLKMRDMGMGEEFEVQPGAGLEVGDGRE